ncbi:MAG: TraB/GumN family protein [Candidatus Krumholzibacteriia bacterium]
MTWSRMPSWRHLGWGVALLLVGAGRPPAAERTTPTGRPLLWRIEAAAPSHLYGTIHIGDERVLALPALVQSAIDSSDALYTEIPLDASTMAKVLTGMMLPPDETLADALPQEVYARTSAYLTSKGFDIRTLSRFEVWAIASMLTFLDSLQDRPPAEPLDQELYRRATAAGKQVGGIETVEEQLALFEAFSREEHVALLVKTLDLLEEAQEQGTSFTERLIREYLEGDAEELRRTIYEFSDPSDALDRKFDQVLLTGRNARMAERMARKIREQPQMSFFFAVGAGHLGGEDGVVALLRARGFTLRHISPRAVTVEPGGR